MVLVGVVSKSSSLCSRSLHNRAVDGCLSSPELPHEGQAPGGAELGEYPVSAHS